MTAPYVPTETESDLLDTACQVLGDNLFGFLLSGLGGPHDRRRRYMARSMNAHGAGLIYQLEAVGESEKGLPGGRDPVVIAALLHLLLTVGGGRDEVVFRDEELIAVLSWPDTRASRLSAWAAIRRFHCTGYHRTNRQPLGPGRGELVSSQVQKLVIGYETTEEWEVGTPKGKRKSTILHFSKKLVEELSGAEKYFLGIDFEKLESVQPIL